MNKTTITLILAGLVILVGGVLAMTMGSAGNEQAETPTAQLMDSNQDSDTMQNEEAAATETNVKEFVIDGGEYYFKPDTMVVKKGDTVRITLKNVDGFHDLKIDEFNVATEKLPDGGEDTVEFVADKVGSFEYYCSIGKHRENGMKGTLTVTE